MTVECGCSTNRYAPLECLPQEIFGKIVKRFAANDPNGPFTALKAMESLSQVSKRICSVVRSDYIIGLFVYTILMKYRNVPKHVFYKLNIFALRRYIRRHGLDKKFKIAQKLRLYMLELCREVEDFFQCDRCFQVDYELSRRLLPRGFSLRYSHFYKELEVIHPFGSTSVSYQREDVLASLAEAMIHRLHASFEGGFIRSLFSEREALNYFAVTRLAREGDGVRRIPQCDFKKLSEADIEGKKGWQQLIFSASPINIFSTYKIQRAFGQVLTENRCESNDLMRIISKVLHFECSIDIDFRDSKKRLQEHLQNTLVNVLESNSSKVVRC